MKDKRIKILIVGCLSIDAQDNNGQVVKTRELYKGLVDYYGKDTVDFVDTKGWKRHPIKLLIRLFKKTKVARNVIMLPAHNGVRVFSRLLLFLRFLNDFGVFYDVVGGWIAEYTARKRGLKKCLLKFDGIWVETSTMKSALECQGFTNVCVIRNFKNLELIHDSKNRSINDQNLHLCTFSRVMEEKGIEDAVQAVREINEDRKSVVVYLDIYGQVWDTYIDRFDELVKGFPPYIRYMGNVDPSKSTNVLSDYDALLFPTHFVTEGIPGTIIDGYAAGTPVVSAIWRSYHDVVEEGITGIGYSMFNIEALKKCILTIMDDRELLHRLSENCILEARKYTPEVVIPKICERLK